MNEHDKDVAREGEVLRSLERKGLISVAYYAEHARVSDPTAYRRFSGIGGGGMSRAEVTHLLRSPLRAEAKSELSDLVHEGTSLLTTFLDDYDASDEGRCLGTFATATRQTAEAMEAAVAAHADGVFSRDEKDDLKRRIKQLIRTLNCAHMSVENAPERKHAHGLRVTG